MHHDVSEVSSDGVMRWRTPAVKNGDNAVCTTVMNCFHTFGTVTVNGTWVLLQNPL